MAVVHLSDEGEGKRWSSLEALLRELAALLFFGTRGSGGAMYYLWTNLWLYWPIEKQATLYADYRLWELALETRLEHQAAWSRS